MSELATAILNEKDAAHHDSIRALWRVGDRVLAARDAAPSGSWRRVVAQCAAIASVHPSFLDDAARAATAFPRERREDLLACFAGAGTHLTRSHIVTLSRMTPARRTRAMEVMLRSPCSVAELRSL